LGPKGPESKRVVGCHAPEHPGFVMAGLDPAIHVLLFQSRSKKDVNARDT
jgi:hypothetical protein